MVLDAELVRAAVALAVGILFCIVPSNWIVPPILKLADDAEEIPAPDGIDPGKWKEALTVPNKRAGGMLGFLERLVTLIALSMNAPTVIAAWLAFKVATKWEVWSNVIQVPTKLNDATDISYLSARRKWGSSVFMRFLLGTLSNIILGMVAFGLTWVILRSWSAK